MLSKETLICGKKYNTMKLKYITPVLAGFISIFFFTYGSRALYIETDSIDSYYEKKIAFNDQKYKEVLDKKELESEKIRIQKEIEEKNRKEAALLEQERQATQARQKAAQQNLLDQQKQQEQILLQKKINEQIAARKAALAAEEERKRIAARNAALAADTRRSRNSRAS